MSAPIGSTTIELKDYPVISSTELVLLGVAVIYISPVSRLNSPVPLLLSVYITLPFSYLTSCIVVPPS
jgi:hypothetical protein